MAGITLYPGSPKQEAPKPVVLICIAAGALSGALAGLLVQLL